MKKTTNEKTVAKKTAKKPKPPGPRTLAAFYTAIIDGNVEGVAKHLPDLANVARVGKYGGDDPPLVIAAGVHDNIEIVRRLLDAGADVTGSTNPFKQNALHVACGQNQLDTATLLIERGVPVNDKDIDKETPYMQARHPEIRARLRAAGVPGFAGRGGKQLHPKSKVVDSEAIEASDGMLAFDSEGRAWIASHQGIYCKSGDTVTRYTFERDLNGATGWRTSGIGAGAGGKMYIGVNDGLIEVDGKTFTLFDRTNSELVDAHYATTGPDGRAYMVSRETEEVWPVPQYITVFDGNTFTQLVAGRDFPGGRSESAPLYIGPEGLEIRCLAFDPDGNLVIGAKGAIAFKRDGAWHVEREAGLFDSASVYEIIVERDVTWIGTQRGVIEQREGRGQLHRTDGLAHHLAKRGDDLYIGYGYDPVRRLRGGTVETVAVQKETLPPGEVSDVAAGPDGKIWVVVGKRVVTL